MIHFLLVVIILFVTGCSSVQTTQEWQRLFNLTKERVGAEIRWEQSEEDKKLIAKEVKKLLSNGLTMDDAVKIALLNNRKLQAKFEDIGIGKADLVQAGFFTNPNLNAIFKSPLSKGGTALELGGIINIADLWQIPIRKKVAASKLEKTIHQISEEILNTVSEAKKAYINYVVLSLIRDEAKEIKHKVNELKDHIIYRKGFGYATELDVYMAEVSALDTDVEFSKIESELSISRYKLNRVLGLSPEKRDYEIIRAISQDLIDPPTYEKALNFAILNRPDIHIAKMHIEEARNAVELEKSRIISDIKTGVIYEEDSEGENFLGADISIQLPIFHQNQAQIAMAEYKLRQAEKTLQAIMYQIQEEILVILERLSILAQKINILKNQILPIRKAAIGFAEKYFNAMELNMVYLLEAQKKYLESKKDYLFTLKEYHEQIIELERITAHTLLNR